MFLSFLKLRIPAIISLVISKLVINAGSNVFEVGHEETIRASFSLRGSNKMP